MKIARLAGCLIAAQIALAGAAFAGESGVTVPEPASLALLAGGLGAIALVRKVRRRK